MSEMSVGPANRLRQGYGGPPKLHAKAEAGHYAVMAWVAALMMAATVSASLLRIPIQIPDSLLVMLQVQAAPSAALTNFVGEQSFLRPVYMSQTRLLLDAAAGSHYFLVFRGFHVALVVTLFALFVLAARVRARGDFAAFAFALVVVAGHHTFRGNVWGADPVNHYPEIAIWCLGALVLSQSRGGWWADLLAGVVFAAASLTLESGLIVWVVFVVGRLVGLRGVSWKGVAFVTVLLCGYFYLRFAYLETGAPVLEERSTGFGFGRLDPDEIVRRFADAPYLLFAYNVVSSILSVLLSEPRNGTWEMTRRWVTGEMTPSVAVALVSSLIATGLIVWFAADRWRLWRAGRFEPGDQLVAIFIAVLAANAVISYGYTKDEIMSTAGVFYALAVFAAARAALARFASIRRRAVATVALAALLCVASSAWAIRATGLHYHMYNAGYYTRNEWASVELWLRQQRVEPASPEAVRLVEALRAIALDMPTLNPHFLPRWAERWFES